jgi:hypothetical protein
MNGSIAGITSSRTSGELGGCPIEAALFNEKEIASGRQLRRPKKQNQSLSIPAEALIFFPGQFWMPPSRQHPSTVPAGLYLNLPALLKIVAMGLVTNG